KKLSQKQLEAANKDIEIWRQELNQCINTDQTGVVRVKVAGTLDSHGKLIPDSLKFYFEQNGAPDGGVVYIPAPLSQIPTPQAVEKDSYDAISSTVKDTLNMKKQISASANYNRISAANYANYYTSNTSALCTSSILANPYYWNTNVYPTYKLCADCADYISQSMRAGGIPTSNYWYYDQNYSRPEWWTANGLRTYMVLNGYMNQATNLNQCVAGYPFFLMSGGSAYHAMMMVSNDGTTRRLAAHTSDRKWYIWNGTISDAYYYYVIY
ncbi:MAG: amidase domain-containing protein, partial [Actinobacteria bacterium]|nr:amidase domain-containing protein [Actinomycetota bacterium]